MTDDYISKATLESVVDAYTKNATQLERLTSIMQQIAEAQSKQCEVCQKRATEIQQIKELIIKTTSLSGLAITAVIGIIQYLHGAN